MLEDLTKLSDEQLVEKKPLFFITTASSRIPRASVHGDEAQLR